MLYVFSAWGCVYLRELFAAPEFVQATDPGVEVVKHVPRVTHVRKVDWENISDVYVFNVALAAIRAVFRGNVLAQSLLGFFGWFRFSWARNASCGEMLATVFDNPDGFGDDTPAIAARWSSP
jgi:hypothetical protein